LALALFGAAIHKPSDSAPVHAKTKSFFMGLTFEECSRAYNLGSGTGFRPLMRKAVPATVPQSIKSLLRRPIRPAPNAIPSALC
jgi:hypothetical protein